MKEKILKERLEKEEKEVVFSIKVSEQEFDVVTAMAFNSLLKYRKLDFLKRASEKMKKECFFFNSECKKVYSMSIVYLESEMKNTQKELEEFETMLGDSDKRLSELKEKLALIEQGVPVETAAIALKPAIPELKNKFKCKNVAGWNPVRGIFVLPSELNNGLPFSAFVKDVVSLDSGGYGVVAEADKFTLGFNYVKTPSVKKEEVLNAGKKLFSGAKGNSVSPGNILIFITKNGKFIHPGFMCN
ncbi:MAG: hypothetical protein ACOX2F_10485 [bacterium]